MGTPIRPEPQSLSELMGQREREREQANPIPNTLRVAADATKDVQPGRAARVLKVQGQTAWPTEFIDRNLEVLEVEVAKPDFDADRFWRESPAIAAWMAQDPTRVAAARGRDMERMGRVEGYLKAIGTEVERNTITTQLVEPGLAAMFGRATPEQEAEIAKLRQRQAELPDVLGDRGFVAGIPIAAIGQLPVTLSLYKGAGLGAGIGAATGAALGAVRGAPAGPAGVATGAATGAVRGAFLGSRVGVAVEGIKLEATNAFLDYREMEGVDRETAAAGALIAGTISGALELLPFENVAKTLPGLRRLGKDGIREMLMAPTTRRLLQRYGTQVLTQMGAEGLTEGLQELVQIAGGVLTERYAEGTLNLLSTETILREIFAPENLSRIASAARTGAQSGGGLGAATGGVATAVDAPKVRRAELNAQRMQQAAEAIHGNDREEAVTLAKDAPEAMREAVASVNAEGVYFDIAEFTGYWQTQRTPDGEVANPREVAIALGVQPEEYDAALESGAPIAIPTDRLLVDAMGSPVHRQWFADNFRVTPNELSKAEATKQREMADQAVPEEAADAAIVSRETETEQGLAGLRDRLTAELREAKIGTEELQASVSLWTEVAKTAIQRNPNLPVAEVLRRFERIQTVARPVAAFPDGKAVSQYAVTGETMDRGDGTLVPVLKTTRTARANAARLESIAAEKGDRMTAKQREQLEAARTALADAEAVNKTLTPVDFAALRGPVDVQGMTPEERASVIVESNLESLQQAAFHGTPHTLKGEVRITRADGTIEFHEMGQRLPAEVEAEIVAGTARATDLPGGRFRLDKIGTGEGAQAYGWGLYFAEAQDVAEGYQRRLAGSTKYRNTFDGNVITPTLTKKLKASSDENVRLVFNDLGQLAPHGVEPLADWLRRGLTNARGYADSYAGKQAIIAAYEAVIPRVGRVEEQQGSLYRVDIPDEAVARFLDWDKPLSEQAPEVKRVIATIIGAERDVDAEVALIEQANARGVPVESLPEYAAIERSLNNNQVWQRTGAEFYQSLYRFMPDEMLEQGGNGPREASLALLAAGIPGIKYLDAGSRGAGDGTRNLVVFDDALITITHRNGEPVTAQERTDFLAQEPMTPDWRAEAEQRLQERGPIRSPRGNTYMGVIEKYTVPNPNTDAPVLKANSPLIGASTNAGNADRQSQALDALFAKHPNPLASERAWVDLANDAFSLDRIPMPPFRTIELVQQGAPAIAKEIAGLSDGMKRDAEEGLKTAQRFGKVYAEGKATPDVTAKAFLWSFLSRGVSPYVQEGAFLDAIVSDELTAIMTDAVKNGWSDALAERYSAWADKAIPEGSPGRGTQHNLNAFGKQFLRVMTQRHADAGNRTGLEIIHEMIADGTPSTQIRREFLKRGDRAGIDNKVVSFTLLLLGRTDVLVLDRVQVRNQWNDGRFDGQNIYDTEMGENEKPIAGSGFAEMTFGHKGLLYYEAMERALAPLIAEAYESLGMKGSLGRYHWDSWLLASNQEVGHASVEGLLRDAEGKDSPYVGAFVRQGKYGNYDYGFRYGVLPNGGLSTLVELLDGSGAIVVPREVMADAKHPTRKLLSKLASAAKKRGKQYGTTEPWTAGLTPAERVQYDEGIRSAGTPAPDLWQYDPDAVGREDTPGTPDPDLLPQRDAGIGAAGLGAATAEPLGDTIDVDGVQRPTTNSNGQPIHPTAEGVRNFWRWATEGGRQPIVGTSGRPLVLYHGNPDGVVVRSVALDENGLAFVTPNKEYADSYANSVNRGRGLGNFRPAVAAFYGRASNVLDITRAIPDAVADAVDETAEGAMWGVESKESVAELRKNGVDVVRGFSRTDGVREIEIAFTSSADMQFIGDANSGAFGPTANIFEQAPALSIDVDGVQRPTTNSNGQPIHPTAEGVKNFWRWFGDSKVVDAEGRPLVVYHGGAQNLVGGEFRVPVFIAEDVAGARRYASNVRGGGRVYNLYVRSISPLRVFDVNGAREAVRIANSAGINATLLETEYGYTFDSPEIRDSSPYDGTNILDLSYVERFRQAMVDAGYDSFQSVEPYEDITETELWVAIDKTQVKDIGNSGAFGPTANILRQEGAEGVRGGFITQKGPRSETGARLDGPRLVALFKERNQTTFLHESAHAFLDFWASLADDPRTSPEFRTLVTNLKGELGADPTATLTEAQEEAFAGMFLDYAKTGKAPSVTLRQAFASFAAFLTKLWSFVKGEIVPANENVREILDRLLATDDAIAEARGEFMAPLFPEDAQVNAAFVKARTEAEERTRTEAMKAVVRAEMEWWKKTSEEVRQEVRERVNQDPAYIARQILTTGQMPDGTPMTGSPLLAKLNRAEIVAVLGEEATKALPRGKTGAVYNTKGEGLNLSVAAEALGYANGPALLAALQQTVPIDEQVERVTKATMTERYGDPVNEVSAVAVQAIHNVSLDRMRQLEIEAILRDHPEAFREAMVKAASRPVNVRELKQWAQERLAGRTLKTIRPAAYLSAERKAGQEAVRAVSRGEWAKAVQAKAQQRAAAAMYAEAVAAQEELAKFQDVVARVFGPDERIAKSRNLDIVMAARQFLATQGIGRKQESTQFYLQQLAEYDPDTAMTLEGVVADFAVPPRDDFKSLTFAEFEAVRDAVAELWEAAKQSETMTIAGRKIAKAEAVADIAAVLAEMPDSAVEGAGRDRVATWRDRANKAALTGKASLRRVESWVDWMDKGDINGPVRRYIFAELRDRTAQKGAANTADLTAYDALLNGIRPTLTSADIPAPELGARWVFKGKAHLLGTLLHTGNPSNMAMLLNGRGWTMDGWLRFRDRMVAEGVLTPADFDFVQNVGNLFEAKKPEAQKVYRRMFGRYFDEITREAFTIQFPDGTERTYAGWYTPATKDPDASTKAEQRAADAMLEEAYGMRFPTVQRGFTMTRVQNYEPLLLSLDIVPKHLDAVNKFIYLAEPVREVGRLLRDPKLRAEMDRVNPAIVNELLMPWLQRTSTQVVQTPSASPAVAKYVDPVAKYLRTTAGASFMFLNVANTLEQATGLSVAAVRVHPKFLSLAQSAVLKNGDIVTEVIERDNPFMRERVSTMVMEVRRRIDEITTDPNIFQKAQTFAAEHAYILQSTAQNHVDRIVWYGSYLESIDAGLTIEEARAKANADVRLTQGSFEAVDVSRIETGNPWWRLVAMFASYFNMLANLNATEMQKAVDQMGLKKSMPRLFAVYALGFAVPLLASNLIRRAMMGRAALKDVDGDDDWGYLDDFLAWFFGEQVRGAAAMVPAVGAGVNYGVNLFDNKVFNDQLNISPAISFLESAGRGVKANYDMITGEDFQRRDIRDMLSLFSLMSRVPALGLARPLTYLYDVNEGRANPTGPVDFTRGLLSGQPGR